MKATGVDTLPEEVLQALFQHVNFQQRQAARAPPRPASDLVHTPVYLQGQGCSKRPCPFLWCVRNGQGRFVSPAMPGTIFGSIAGMCWVPPQCFNVCLGLSSDVRRPQLSSSPTSEQLSNCDSYSDQTGCSEAFGVLPVVSRWNYYFSNSSSYWSLCLTAAVPTPDIFVYQHAGGLARSSGSAGAP